MPLNARGRKMKEKILIATASFGEYDPRPMERLKKAGYEIISNPHGRRLRPGEVKELIQDAAGIIAGTEELSGDILRTAKKLRAISRCGVGLDSVDLASAEKLNIKVFSTPDAATEAVAELTMALILSVLRKIPQMHSSIISGKWSRQSGTLLAGKTLGIIGLGRIGKRVVELARPFGVDIIATENSPDKRYVENACIRLVGLEDLLRTSDIVSVHVPFSHATERMLNAKRLGMMKRGAILINTSRGGIVDEEALCKALEAKRIQGAALDVFREEPYSGKLIAMENVVLTPHVGSYAQESRILMEDEAVTNLMQGLAG